MNSTTLAVQEPFKEFSEIIYSRLANPSGPWHLFHESAAGALYSAAKAHRNLHRKNPRGVQTHVWVHPFYDPLREDIMRSFYEAISERFDARAQREESYNLVVFDNPFRYATQTSALLEEGAIDDVLFTPIRHGFLCPKEDELLEQYRGHNITLNGCYEGCCLVGAKDDLAKITDNISTGKTFSHK